MQILLVFSEVSQRITSIPEFGWIHEFSGRIPYLVVDVMITGFDVCMLDPGVTHRADQLARDNRVTYCDMSRMGMKYLVGKAACVPYGYSASSASPGVCHNAG